MPEFETTFAETIRRFDESGVHFVIVGAVAMGLHGSNYATANIDFACSNKPSNIDSLAAFLAIIGARVSPQTGRDDAPSRAMLRNARFLRLRTQLDDVGIMSEVPGLDSFESLWERALPMDLGGFTVRVASIDDLIAMKRAANRPKDQNHLYELLALKKLLEDEQASTHS
jgi:predicted nucleotidyltransferase